MQATTQLAASLAVGLREYAVYRGQVSVCNLCLSGPATVMRSGIWHLSPAVAAAAVPVHWHDCHWRELIKVHVTVHTLVLLQRVHWPWFVTGVMAELQNYVVKLKSNCKSYSPIEEYWNLSSLLNHFHIFCRHFLCTVLWISYFWFVCSLLHMQLWY